jgi:hypothetical protein
VAASAHLRARAKHAVEDDHRVTQTPDEILTDAWNRVRAIQPPLATPPGDEWHFALGALWALGTAGLLDDGSIRQWEALAQTEAKRLGASDTQPPHRPPPR